MARPHVEPFFHEQSSTWTYVIHDGRVAAVVDPAVDFDFPSGRADPAPVARVAAFIESGGLALRWILETHAHADHLSGAPWLKARLGGQVGIGEGITRVQATFKDLLALEAGFATDGSQFDCLFRDGETFHIGALEARVIATPGHTNDSVTYLVGDAAFVGDTVFMPDGGTARCDFPGGDASVLYASIQKLYALPSDTRIFVCHDYAPDGRELRCETSVAEQRRANIHVRDGVSEAGFVALRRGRDATLEVPRLLYPSVQVNVRAGQPPPPDAHGRRYLTLPYRPA
ncbi:MAG: MBL fold metallo-hydrolase [Steroidobacteraceae bacterium]|jgi:glyoxylase-like metal-dependent hydrolase (beta-lactamase superfamily II)|nr:MBL fold metallo-hydrolase [Steroidobacteraceae bacterium]